MSDIHLIYRASDEDLFISSWNSVLSNTKASSRYLSTSIDHNLMLSKIKNKFMSDFSFVLCRNGKPCACVFLPLEKDGPLISISSDSNDGYCDAPLIIEDGVEKYVFEAIDQIARENKVAKIAFSINPIEDTAPSVNILQKYGYVDTSILKYVIDLSNRADVVQACRKGHRSDIKRILRDNRYQTFIMDSKNASYEIHEKYRELHYKCAGRVTYPKDFFDMQYDKIIHGNALLAGLTAEGRSIGFAYFEYNFDKAIYSSGSDDPEYAHLPLYHVLVYAALEYFKQIGVKYLDVEQPVSPSTQLDYYPDQKQLNIGHFKRGFGGLYMNQFRGVKYFDGNSLRNDMNNFVQNYSAMLH